MRSRLNRVLSVCAARSDMIVASFILTAVVMMIIPFPTYVVDVMVGFNIAFSVLILIVAFYSARAVDFSVLPPVILLSTLFWLSLSITTTRLILRDADAGEIVSAFGEYVIAGDVVVGIVIFLIITIAQFIVITKGAERVAEVGARFTLDAMPGKQMSIDADLRNGDIDQAQAKARRQNLERESQLFGAMDGAMKFVKGDAIAGLVILCVNLFGGIVIGTMRHGMSFSDATHTYSLLTVGDGLIAQLPALMTAVAAGIVVTRVNSGRDVDLGAEIIEQLGANAKVLMLSSAILILLALVPGFPAYVFIGLSLVPGVGAVVVMRRRHDAQTAAESPEPVVDTPANIASASETDLPQSAAEWVDPPINRLMLCLSPAAAQQLQMRSLQRCLADASIKAEQALGVSFPAAGFRQDPELAESVFSVCIDDIPVAGGVLHFGSVLVIDDLKMLGMLNVPEQERVVFDGKQAAWISDQYVQDLERLEAVCLYPEDILRESLLAAQISHAPEFLGVQETRQLLSDMEQSHPELVRQALHVLPLQRLAEVLRHLLEERVCIRSLRTILEVVVQGGDAGGLRQLVERIRAALSRHLCHQYADRHRTIGVYVLSRKLEQNVRNALTSNDDKVHTLSAELSSKLLAGLQKAEQRAATVAQPVLMVASDLRRHLRQHLSRQGVSIPVMAYTELASGYVSHPLAILMADGTYDIPTVEGSEQEQTMKEAA